jgi:hypothetical protein
MCATMSFAGRTLVALNFLSEDGRGWRKTERSFICVVSEPFLRVRATRPPMALISIVAKYGKVHVPRQSFDSTKVIGCLNFNIWANICWTESSSRLLCFHCCVLPVGLHCHKLWMTAFCDWHHSKKKNSVANKVTEMSRLAVKLGLFSENKTGKSKQKCSVRNGLIIPHSVTDSTVDVRYKLLQIVLLFYYINSGFT